jgi:hypothetical protein
LVTPVLTKSLHRDNSLFTDILIKKKKLTDIGFVWFSGLRNGSFQWIWILINVVEHQSTSDTKIYRVGGCTRARLPDFMSAEITVSKV